MLFNQSRLILSKCADNKFEIPDKRKASDPNQRHFRLILSIQLSTDYCSQMGIIPRCVTLAVKRYPKCRSTGSPALLAIVHTVGKKHVV